MGDHITNWLKEMEKGSLHKVKGIWKRSKVRIPKWIWKLTPLEKAYHRSFYSKYGRFANNEERILNNLGTTMKYRAKIDVLAKDSNIDYKNISRYLKRLEKKGLIRIESESRDEKLKSGMYKTYHYKEVSMTSKGTKRYYELFK